MGKIYTALLFTFLLAKFSHAQSSSLRDQEFIINPYSISPAYSGFNTNHEIFVNYINHFSGTKGAPYSAWANYNGIVKSNLGLGASLRFEKFGAFRNIRVDVSTAYHLKIGADQKVSVGIGVSVTQTNLDFNNSNSDPINDPSLNSDNVKNGMGINASFGISYAWRKLNIGIAAPAIIPMKMNGKSILYSQPIHARVYAAYEMMINRKFAVKPAFVLDYILHSPINYNAVITVKYDNLLFVNVGFGAQNIFSGGVGVIIAQRFTGQYTFKYGLNGIANSTYGSHEICIGILVGKIKNATTSNSIFGKKNKSPYHDWE